MSKSTRYTLIGLIIALLLVYVIGTIYAKRIAIRQVDTTIASLQEHYGNVIQNIEYQSIDANFFTLFNDNLAINGIKISLISQPNNPLTISQLEITHYQQNADGIPTNFTLRVKQLQFNSFKQMLVNLAHRDDAATYLSLMPIDINPSINASAVYKGTDKTLNILYSIDNQGQTYFQSQTLLSQFQLQQALDVNPADAILTAANQAVIDSSTIDFDYDQQLNQANLASDHGHIAQILKDLGYKTTQLTVQGHGEYQDNTHNSQFNMQVALQNGGTLNLNLAYNYSATRNLHNLVSFLRTGQTPNTDSSEAKLVSWVITYQDQSLTNRIINMVAQNAQQDPNDVKNMLVASLTQTASSAAIPQFKAALQQAANFLNDPNVIAISIQPAKPYSINAINSFISNRFNEDTLFNQSLANLDPSQRLAAYQAYQQQRDAKITDFLTQLGFSVVATPSSANNQ